MNSGKIEFSFMWWIENFSYWPICRGEVLSSPKFTPEGLSDTSWVLSLQQNDPFNGSFGVLHLQRSSLDAGPENILLKLEISVMKLDGYILASDECEQTFRRGEERKFLSSLLNIWFRALRATGYLPGDTLGVRCRMRMSGESVRMVRRFTARTLIGIEKISFLHRVENFSALKPGEEKVLQIPSHSETGCVFTSTLCLKDTFRIKEMVVVNISPSRTNYKLNTHKIYLINVSGNIIKVSEYNYVRNNFAPFKKFKRQFLLDKREEYLPNGELSLLCEFTFYTGVNHGKIEEIIHDIPLTVFKLRYNDPHHNKYNAAEKLSKCPCALDDFKALYSDKLLTDMVLRTATKSFPSHKNMLCARSSVFRAMLTSDMKEKNTACIKVEDLENETVQHLLLFLYSDSLEDLQWESAVQLYYAADKYEIERLKVLCSSFLVDNLNTSTASELLQLADTHSDTELRKIVEDFILEHEEEVFCSVEWEKLNGTNSDLVLKTMQLKYKREKGTHNNKQRTKNNSNSIYNSSEKLSKCTNALDDFKALYIDQLLTDVLLKTATKSFSAHRNVLSARSSVFRAMLTNDMKEKKTGCIKVEDLEDETVQQLLLFLYSDSLEELQWESAIELYNAADKYAIERMKVLCSSFLVDNLDTSTACEFLLLVDTHNDTQLRKIAEDFILQNEEEVFGSEEWERLIETNPQLAIKTMHLKYKKDKRR